jgi:hypothetical protein
VSMFRLSRWQCQVNAFVLIFDLVHHLHNYLLQLGQAVWASVQSIFLISLYNCSSKQG